jgi:hypothetical protein
MEARENMSERKEIHYKLVVYKDGTAEVVGPHDQKLDIVKDLGGHVVKASNVKVAPVVEYTLNSPTIVCFHNRCWYA